MQPWAAFWPFLPPDANCMPSPRTTTQIGRAYRGVPRTGEVASPTSPRSGSRSTRTHAAHVS